MMSEVEMLEVKQALVRMSEDERREVSFYLQKLRYESPEGREEIGDIMRAMDQGDKVPLGELARRLGHA